MIGWEGELPQPTVRTIGEMRPVLADPACTCSGPLYFMYRDVAASGADRRWLHRHSLRYDITAIPPRELCGEYVKTKGHYHPDNPAGTGYPELYEVLAGRAHYLLQSREARDVVLVEAEKDDVVLIPPGYGHISVNPSKTETLVMANIVSTAFESEYGEYEALRGAAYYEMSSGALVPNPRYGRAAPVKKIRSPDLGKHRAFCSGPIYSLVGDGPALAFLNHPEVFSARLSALLKD